MYSNPVQYVQHTCVEGLGILVAREHGVEDGVCDMAGLGVQREGQQMCAGAQRDALSGDGTQERRLPRALSLNREGGRYRGYKQ